MAQNSNDPNKRKVLLLGLLVIGLILAGIFIFLQFRDKDSSGSGSGGQDGGLTVVTTEGGTAQEKTEASSGSESTTEKKSETETVTKKTEAPTEKETVTEAGTETESETRTETETEKKTESESTGKSYRFRSKKLLNEHFEKHGIEMGFADTKEYVAAANDVIKDPESLHKIEKEDGDDIYYRERDNAFVVVSTDGYIRTFFYPNGGKKYYDRQ